jgi:hypothetical protein
MNESRRDYCHGGQFDLGCGRTEKENVGANNASCSSSVPTCHSIESILGWEKIFLEKAVMFQRMFKLRMLLN